MGCLVELCGRAAMYSRPGEEGRWGWIDERELRKCLHDKGHCWEEVDRAVEDLLEFYSGELVEVRGDG